LKGGVSEIEKRKAYYSIWEGGEGGLRVPTSDPHTINSCWFLFLLFAYLLVAEAASFDKTELCRSDTAAIVLLTPANFYHCGRLKFNFQPLSFTLRPLATNLQKQKSLLGSMGRKSKQKN
jgi:hypothetical protein